MFELCHSVNTSELFLMMFTIETRVVGGVHTVGSGVESLFFSTCASYARRERMTDFIRYEVEEGDIASFR